MIEDRMNRFSFRFDELKIDSKLIENTLGFNEGLPEPFNLYLEEAWQFSTTLSDISAIYTIVDNISFKENKTLVVNELEFNVGAILSKELQNSEYLAVFVCTAGKTISSKSKELMQTDNACLGYTYDVMGSFIVEAVGDKLQELIQEEVSQMSCKITNRYSPGYCQWEVNEQQKLFSIFPKNYCNVHLTSSGLMQPVKSISGVIGIGKKVKFRDYTCGICSLKNCNYKRKHSVIN